MITWSVAGLWELQIYVVVIGLIACSDSFTWYVVPDNIRLLFDESSVTLLGTTLWGEMMGQAKKKKNTDIFNFINKQLTNK